MSEEVSKYKINNKSISDFESLLESAYVYLIEAHKVCSSQNRNQYNRLGKIIDELEELFVKND